MKRPALLLTILTLAVLSCSKPASPATQPAPGAQPGSEPAAATSSDFAPDHPPAVQPAGASTQAASAGPAAAPGTPPAAQGQATAAPTPASPQTPAPSPAIQPSAAPQRQIGELVYAEGSVMVHRAGSGQERLDIGDVVRQYDVLITGPKSKAEVDLAAGRPGGASVKLAENTAFYFDTKELSPGERRTVLQLLGGAIAVKVDKLAGGSFSVATDSSVMGVRGTVFVVDTVPDGAFLVTCSEGAVAVESDGVSLGAKPGQAVGQAVGQAMQAVPVAASELGSYRSAWKADAFAGFASRALQYTSSYAAALDAGRASFAAAYAKLAAQSATLAAWRDARASGRAPKFTDWTAEKKAVAAVLFDCLKGLFLLERPYYRLIELKAWHEAGTGVGTLKDGRDSAAFFKGFETAYRDLADAMAAVREALDLFSWASAGSPLGDFFGAKADSLGNGALFLGD